jgi:AraC-like DNA-binding protein
MTLSDLAQNTPEAGVLARVGPLALIPALIGRFGHDPAMLLADAGMCPSLLSDPENSVSFSALCRLLDICSRRFACSHFGVLLGEQVELSHLGLLGVLMRLSRDVGEALQLLARHQGFHLQMNGLAVDFGPHQVQMAFNGPFGIVGSDQAGDSILAGLCAMLRTLCGPGWSPTQVHFAHPMPLDSVVFRGHFRCPLVFSESDYVLSFPARHLSRTLANVEPDLLRIVARRVEQASLPVDSGFTAGVYEAIEMSIRSGRVSSAFVAAALGVPVRTLSRHLDRRGLTFQAMLDEVRSKAAARMLADPQLGIARIAEYLGYASSASFIRAFRRWRGKTPSAWRASLDAGAE